MNRDDIEKLVEASAIEETQVVLEIFPEEFVIEKFIETFSERITMMLSANNKVIAFATAHNLKGGAIAINMENEVTDAGVVRMTVIIPGVQRYNFVINAEHNGLRLSYGDLDGDYTRVETRTFSDNVFKNAEATAELTIALHDLVSDVSVDAVSRINGLKEGRLQCTST